MSPEDKLAMALMDERLTVIEMAFTQMRLDLKSAGILHDEEYIAPDMRESTSMPKEFQKSDKVKELEKKDPF